MLKKACLDEKQICFVYNFWITRIVHADKPMIFKIFWLQVHSSSKQTNPIHVLSTGISWKHQGLSWHSIDKFLWHKRNSDESLVKSSNSEVKSLLINWTLMTSPAKLIMAILIKQMSIFIKSQKSKVKSMDFVVLLLLIMKYCASNENSISAPQPHSLMTQSTLLRSCGILFCCCWKIKRGMFPCS